MSFFSKLKEVFSGTQAVDGVFNDTFYNNMSVEFPMYSSRDPKNLTKTDYLKYYTGRSFVAVSTIANHFAGLQYSLVNKQGKEITDSKMKFINYNLFLNIASYLKLNGSCFLWINKSSNLVLDLVVLRPDLVKVVLNDARTSISHYEYNRKEFSIDEIIPIHQFNPLQPYPNTINGVGDVEAVSLTIDSDRKASERNRQFFNNSARPDGVLTTDKSVSPDVTEMIQDKREEKNRSVNNAQKIAILTNGLKYQVIAPTGKDMDFIEGKRLNRDEILAIYKVPKALIGLGEGGQTLNIGKFERIFAKEVINPLAIQVGQAFTRYLFKDQATFQFMNVVPYDQTEMRSNFVVDAITLNEFRKTIGFPMIDGGDVFRSEQVSGLNSGKNVTPKDESEKIFKESLTEDLQNNIKSIVYFAVKSQDKDSEEFKQKKREEKIERNNNYEKQYEEKLLEIFQRQEKEIISEFKKWYKTQDKKDFKVQYPIISTTKRGIVYYDLLKKTQEGLFESEANKALLEVGIGEPATVTTPAVQKLLRDNIKKFSFEIDTVTNEKLVKQFAYILDNGLGVNKGVELLKDTVFKELKTSRVEKIVRTETIRAGNAGTQYGYEESGVVEGKERYTALDERVCPFCGPMNGKVIDLKKTFFEKGDTVSGINDKGKTVTMKTDYSEIEHPPLHPQCRCVILPVVQ